MLRRFIPLAILGLLISVSLTQAADPAPPAGFWKLSVPTGQGDVVLMLAFSEQDGKWTGEYLGSSEKLVAEPKFKTLKVSGDLVQFTLELKGESFLTFDGLLTKDKKKLAGSMTVFTSKLMLTELHPTKLKRLDDSYELARETLTQVEAGPLLFEAAAEVLSKAGAKKLPPDEARAILDRVNKAATGYGPRWEREITLRLAESLAEQDGLGEVAVAQAKRAERLLTDDDDAATRLKVLESVVKALTKAGKADEAKPYVAQVAKLEVRDYAEYAKTFPFKVVPFAGRKGKSDRGVLVEVFTGAECPPCAATDIAFDGLMRTYKPTDVVLLQYHIHVPGPDPLTNAETMKRAEDFYGDQIRGTPTIFIAGKPGPSGAGPASAAEKKYNAFREPIEEALEKPAGVKLGLTVGKGEKGGYSAKATVTDLEMPGEKIVLRFALAEERVRYTGGNGIRYHHMVVRAMPGGQKGFALTKKTAEQSVTFDLAEIHKELVKYLDEFAKEEAPFPRPDRPMALKNLKLVAFVQNDTTRDVLHAVQVDVDTK
jgi:hypothetical protein